MGIDVHGASALIEPHLSRLLWLCATLAMVGSCIEWSWQLYDGDNSKWRLKWLVGVAFAPTLTVLIIGQIGPLILLALITFLIFERRRQDFVAGMLVMPAAVKPQLLYVFWVALLFWGLRQRRWSLLAGLAVALLICSGVAVALDPAIFSQYFSLWRNQGVLDQAYPVLGGVLRLIFGVEKRWLQFIPAVVGLAWFLQYWRTHRDDWEWRERVPVVLLVSLVTTPYAWFFDQVVLLPVVMQCTIWLVCWRGSLAVQAAGAFAASNLVAFQFGKLWMIWQSVLIPM